MRKNRKGGECRNVIRHNPNFIVRVQNYKIRALKTSQNPVAHTCTSILYLKPDTLAEIYVYGATNSTSWHEYINVMIVAEDDNTIEKGRKLCERVSAVIDCNGNWKNFWIRVCVIAVRKALFDNGGQRAEDPYYRDPTRIRYKWRNENGRESSVFIKNLFIVPLEGSGYWAGLPGLTKWLLSGPIFEIKTKLKGPIQIYNWNLTQLILRRGLNFDNKNDEFTCIRHKLFFLILFTI